MSRKKKSFYLPIFLKLEPAEDESAKNVIKESFPTKMQLNLTSIKTFDKVYFLSESNPFPKKPLFPPGAGNMNGDMAHT